MALIKHLWTWLDMASRKQGFDSPRLQPSPGRRRSYGWHASPKANKVENRIRHFGRRLSAIVRRHPNGGGPRASLLRHSAFARPTPELRLARQPKSQQGRE